MTSNVKIVECFLGYKVQITSGYRAGNYLCHGYTDLPIVWTDKEPMTHWLTDTGFTVFDQQKPACAGFSLSVTL